MPPALAAHEPKELKVRIPTRMHLRLHAARLLCNRNISDIVEEAVEKYMADQIGASDANAFLPSPIGTAPSKA